MTPGTISSSNPTENVLGGSIGRTESPWTLNITPTVLTVRLVTFPPKRYMTGEDLKVTFGTQKKVELSLWTNPQNYIERFVILSKNNEDISFSIFE